jgi:PTS system nitrogen regulatory IIA component
MFPENFLVVGRIGCRYPAASKKRAVQQIGELLASGDSKLDEDAVFDKLLERERLGSTGLGHGVALPHARMKGVQQARGAFLQLEKGVDFDAIDNQPVDLVFGLLVPQSATEEHLQMLAGLASLFSDVGTCEQLRRSKNPDEILQRILAGA